MFRKVLLAVAATVVVGSAALVTFDDASAARRGGGFSGGGMRSAPARMGRPSMGGQRFAGRPGMRRPGGSTHRRAASSGGSHQRHGSSGGGHRRHGSSGGGHRRHGSFGGGHRRHGSFGGHHHRFGSHGHHFRHGSRGSHFRFGSRGSHFRRWSWGGGYVAPTPGYIAPVGVPVRAGGPVCYSCGGWTKNGCYMTYRKFIDANGRAVLRCVEACDTENSGAAPQDPQEQAPQNGDIPAPQQ